MNTISKICSAIITLTFLLASILFPGVISTSFLNAFSAIEEANPQAVMLILFSYLFLIVEVVFIVAFLINSFGLYKLIKNKPLLIIIILNFVVSIFGILSGFVLIFLDGYQFLLSIFVLSSIVLICSIINISDYNTKKNNQNRRT
jgi:hypothetical protein